MTYIDAFGSTTLHGFQDGVWIIWRDCLLNDSRHSGGQVHIFVSIGSGSIYRGTITG